MKKKNPTRMDLCREIDRRHAAYITLRDGYRCVVCGSMVAPTCGHLFTRGNKSTRWDAAPDGNCHCQCWPCNEQHEVDPSPFENWYKAKFGEERFLDLKRRTSATRNYNFTELVNLRRLIIRKLHQAEKESR